MGYLDGTEAGVNQVTQTEVVANMRLEMGG